MSPVDESRRRRPRPAARRITPLLSAAVLLALAGCQGDYGTKQGDPFLGVHAPATPAPVTGAGSSTATPAQTTSTTVPPLPGAYAATSPAALASNTTPTPDSPRSLRIGDAPVVPASLPSPGAVRGAAPGGAMLGDPQPVPEVTSRLAPVANTDPALQRTAATPPVPAAVPPAASSGGSMTFEQAQQYLRQRGVVWQRLETWGDRGQWKFQCSMPIPGSTNMNRTYVTDTPLPSDPLTAVRAVLDKIEKDQQR
jgi:hypothetical protein